ncbi:hypothetical protein ABZV77_28580 [Streptomyces sp. NPDC004732]|uniref:hypothetical protein n=1 Tax=Streptomyces sp. NPDC004732 TaxID=3154290 RepID=UPI0033A5EF15
MRTPVSGLVSVAYGQLYVESGPDGAGLGFHDACAGQENGLCGAAIPGFLYLNSGLHTGELDFTVEVHESPPLLEDQWEEIVEVSFRPVGPETALALWGGMGAFQLGLEEIDYRVRYCGSRLDEAVDREDELIESPGMEEHLLQFWPAPPERDRLVKQTGNCAAYWHRTARDLPSAERRAEQRAEAQRREREAAERATREAHERYERHTWGGRLPSDRLRNVGGSIWGVLELDSELAHALDRLAPEQQRAVARWAARRAAEEAGLDRVDWMVPALEAAERGRPLPAPFDDHGHVVSRILDDPAVPDTTVAPARPTYPAATRQQFSALPALYAAVEDDPLRAALDAVFAAAVTVGRDYAVLLAELRVRFSDELGPPDAPSP